MVLFHQHLGHQHGEDVHLFLEFHGIYVSAYHHGLFGLGKGHPGKGIQEHGIYHFGPVEGHVAEVIHGGTVYVADIAVFTGGNTHTGQESRVQLLARSVRQRRIPLDDSDMGISFGRRVGNHVITDTAGQAASLDATVLGQAGKGLRWHNC